MKHFTSEITKLKLNRSKTNIVYQLSSLLLIETFEFTRKILDDDNGMDCPQSLNASLHYVRMKLLEHQTTYKRNKHFGNNEMYVEPKEMAVGLRWDLVRDYQTLSTTSCLVQCKFQYISILKTLGALFQRSDFREVFFSKKNSTIDGYNSFQSGETYKSNELFQTNQNSIQIHIATDDFEVCNELGSKSTIHKICAFYFCIRNVPQKYLSKLDNIYLLLLCNSSDIKTLYTDINDVLRPIVEELKYLENIGVNIGSNENLKGTLANFSFDNLGANTTLGFVEGFNTSSSYCRICECTQAECKKLCIENESKLRNMEKYKQQIERISNMVKVDFSKTAGVKRYCVLNDLKYFNIFDNVSVDIMHDLNEGVIPFLVKNLLEFCYTSKIICEGDFKQRVENFNFGVLSAGHAPTSPNLKLKNLHLNASQSKCLFEHLPFLLFHEQNTESLKAMWVCVTTLLVITQIAYSWVIKESDLVDLKENVRIHLESIQKFFKKDLLPKHHFLLHYDRVIRLMGPLISMSMMRFESKHKVLKGILQSSANYINVTKSIATKHQQIATTCGDSYRDYIESGIAKRISDEFIASHVDLLYNIRDASAVKWLKLNHWTYRCGLFVIESGFFQEIIKILSHNNDYMFFVQEYVTLEYIKNLNSVKIMLKNPSKFKIFKFDTLKNQRVYEKKIFNEEFYVIMDTLDTKYSLNFEF